MSTYAMLPSNWHGIIPAEKLNVVNDIDLHGLVFSLDLFKALQNECSIPFK